MKTTTLGKSNSCLKIKERSSKRPKRSSNMISITNGSWGSSSRISWSSSKNNSAEKMSTYPSWNLKSITSFIRTKTSLLKTRDWGTNSHAYKIFMEAKSTNWKHSWGWRPEITMKWPLNITMNSRNSRRRDKTT